MVDDKNAEWLNRKRTDPVERYREYAVFQFATDGEGIGLREAREALTGIDVRDYEDLDGLVVDTAIEAEYINPSLLEDDPAQPMQKWWWHLGAIRDGTYPLGLLPEPLRTAAEPPLQK